MSKTRQRNELRGLTTEVARLVVDDGLELQEALRDAVGRLGLALPRPVPAIELRAAINEYRKLFKPHQLTHLTQQRRLAREAMNEFSAFRPRLFGDLVHGDGPLNRIRLMLIADTPEQVMHHLSDRHIPWQDGEAVLSYSGRRRAARPCLRFLAGESTVELVLLEPRSHSDPPRDPLTGGPMETLGVDQLDALIADRPA